MGGAEGGDDYGGGKCAGSWNNRFHLAGLHPRQRCRLRPCVIACVRPCVAAAAAHAQSRAEGA